MNQEVNESNESQVNDDVTSNLVAEESKAEQCNDATEQGCCDEPKESVGDKISSLLGDVPKEAITAIYIEKFLRYLKKGFLADFFDGNDKWFTKAGLIGMYIFALQGLLFSFIVPFRFDINFFPCFGAGVLWFFVIIILHYICWEFLGAIVSITKTTRLKLPSNLAMLDSMALVTGILSVISFFAGIFIWIKTSDSGGLFLGVGGTVLFIYIMSFCLNPEKLNIEVTDKTTPGEEFLSIISFFMIGYLKFVPILFAIGILGGIVSFTELIFTNEFTQNDLVEVFSTFSFLVLPLVSYFIFLFYYFIIDLALAVLSLPSTIKGIEK